MYLRGKGNEWNGELSDLFIKPMDQLPTVREVTISESRESSGGSGSKELKL